MRLESGRARRCYRGCVRSPSDGSLRHPAVLKGTGAFDPVVNVGNRGRGRGIREGGVQRLRQTAPELDDDRSLVSKLRFLHKCPEAVDVCVHGFSGPLEVFRVLQFDHCSLRFCNRVEFVAESIHERLDGDPDIRSGGCVVSDRAVPPSPGPTRCHEREDPPDLCFRRGGGSGLELEVEAACVGEGFTGLAGSIELRRRVCLEDGRTGTGCDSGLCFECQDTIAEE